MNVCYFILIGVCFVLRRTYARIKCLSCDIVPQPLDCTIVQECSEHEKCYTEKYEIPGGNVMYKVGCIDQVSCSSTSLSPVGKRRSKSSIAAAINLKRSNSSKPTDIELKRASTSICTECCDDQDICNIGGHCDAQPFNQIPGQTLCFSCPYVLADPDQCRQIALCGQDQFCSVVMTKNIADQPRYHIGCSSQSQCQFPNTECCKEKLCNNQITMPRFKNPQENPTITMKYHTDEIVRICEALGNPKPHMVYEFAHRDPLPTNYYQSNGFLYISHYSTENDGPYRCYATNKFGSVMKNFTLKGS